MKKLVLLLLCIIPCTTQAAPIIPSDLTNPSQSFPFPIKAFAFDPEMSIFFVGANTAVADNNFAVAGVHTNQNRFSALAPQQVTLNYTPDSVNPLFGAQINFLSVWGAYPLVVAANNPQQLFVINDYRDLKNILMLGSAPLTDLNEAVSAGIVGLLSFMPNDDFQQSVAWVALKNNAGSFGASGSVLVRLKLLPVQIKNEKDEVVKVQYVLAPDLKLQFDVNVPALYINSPLASINNDTAGEPVTMTVDEVFNPRQQFGAQNQEFSAFNTYTGILATGGPAPSDGVMAVALNGVFPITSPNAVEADSIVASVGSSTTVSIHFVNAFKTSTSLHYLAVVGGVGDAANTKRMVFALPLINDVTGAGFGQLAARSAVPVDRFSLEAPYKFQTRVLQQYAVNPGDLYTSTDIEVMVGGGAELPNDITGMFVAGDAIYVTTSAGNNQIGGIFYSQALFNNTGLIKGWTSWQRAGIQGNAFGGALDTKSTTYFMLEGNDATTIFNVKRTLWGSGTSGISMLVSQALPEIVYGAQGITDVQYTFPAFNQMVGSRISPLLFTGYKKVLFVQGGTDFGGEFQASENIMAPTPFADGTLQGFSPANSLLMSGGVLDNLRAIVTSTIAYQGSNGWFVVGGNGGLAILRHDDGTGFTLPLSKNFAGLDNTLQWQTLLNLTNVKKIIAQQNVLYILTTTGFYRYMITPQNLIQSSTPVTLATAADLPGTTYFLDAAVSDDFALVATSAGLWRVGNGASIQTAFSAQDAQWTCVPFNEFPGAVTQLSVISPDGFDTNFKSGVGGNIYAVAGYPGYHQTRVYRFTVTPGAINDTTLAPLPDYFIKDLPTFYINVGDYRNGMYTDGGLFLFTRSRYAPTETAPFVQQVPVFERLKDRRFAIKNSPMQTLNFISSLHSVTRRSSGGGLMVAGDTGLQVNE